MKLEQDIKRLLRISLYQNAIFLILNNLVTAILGFAFWVVVARFYSEIEVGYSSAIISAINFIALVGLLGLNRSMVRFLPTSDRPVELINSYFTVGALASLAVSLVFLGGVGLWSPAIKFVRDNAIFALTFVGTAIIYTLAVITNSVFVAKRKARFVLFTNTLGALLKIPLPIGFALVLHSFGIIASWMISLIVVIVLAILVFMPRIENKYKPFIMFRGAYIKQTWKYAGSSYIASLCYNAPVLLLPLLVLNVLGIESNAYFYVAWIIAGVLYSIPGSVSESLFAESSYDPEKIGNNVSLSFKLIFLLLFPSLVILFLVGKWLLFSFGPDYSTHSLSLLWILGGTSVFIAVVRVYFALLRVADKLLEMIVIELIIAVLLLTTSYFILPLTGINGIGYTWLSIHALLALVLIFRMRRLVKESAGKQYPA